MDGFGKVEIVWRSGKCFLLFDNYLIFGVFVEVFIISMVLSGVLCAVIAQIKNYSGPLWFVLGFFFPVVAPIVIIFFKQTLTEENAPPSPKTHIKCPDCKELVKKDARVCKHCGCKLVPEAGLAGEVQPSSIAVKTELNWAEKKVRDECLEALHAAGYTFEKEEIGEKGISWTVKGKSGRSFSFSNLEEMRQFAEIYKKKE